MQVVEKKLKDIVPYEKNPRKNDSAVDAVASSISQFGFKVPVVIDKDGVIVCGHTRYKAAKKLGLEAVPCVVADDLTEEQIKAYRLADNKVAELAEWDFNMLGDELENIFDFDMSDFGFDEVVTDDDYGTDFSLADGEKSEICQITFTFHEKQKELIEYAMSLVKDDIVETFGNENKRGNQIYEVVRQWAEQKK